MASISFRQRLRYKFDNFMARGGSSIFIALIVMFLVSLVFVGALRGVVNWVSPPGAAENPGGFFHHLYQTFNHLSDPGTMAYDINSSIWLKITAIIAGGIGVVILSSLIAFITTELDQRINQLKKGHSKVIETGHTLLLGWNERVLEILRELLIANESEDDACVVILADKDKEFMDDYLNVNLSKVQRGNTRIVTRSGSVSSLVNLDIVSVTEAKSVISLATCGQSATYEQKAASDTAVIKTILALMASRKDGQELTTVAEVFNRDNRAIVEQISPGDIITVDTDEILAKILVQTSRSVGLSVVYNEVMSFDGCEMYFHHADWGDTQFGELPFRFPDGIPIGIRHEDGTISINPSPDTPMQQTDDIIILAEDDSTIDYQSQPLIAPRDLNLIDKRRSPGLERELIIGWTPKIEIILHEYADYLLDGSQIDVMLRAADSSVVDRIASINEELDGVIVSLVEGNPMTTDGLMSVKPFEYDNILILSQTADHKVDNEEQTDSETIVILLLLRSIFEQHHDQVGDTKLITEILDSDNQPLVARTGVKDFVISNRFVSMILAQISEDGDIKAVYDDLFQEDGSEIYLKPISLYHDHFPLEVNYADLIQLAQKREEICLGVKLKLHEHMHEKNFGVKLIPPKNQTYTLNADDCLVVVAEDET